MGQRICSVDGCGSAHYARGWCHKHYKRWRHQRTDGSVCSIPECGGPAVTRGLCSKHYQRWRSHGDSHYVPPTVFERWAAKASGRESLDGCWEWQASKRNGYGVIGVDAKVEYAHRFAYEHFIGPIPEGRFIDHVCRNTGCVNPSHLRLATPKQNCEHQGLSSANTSGYRGVSFHKRMGKWRAYVGHNGEMHTVGYFDTPEEASKAATALRNKLFTHNDLDRRGDGRQGSTDEPRLAN